MPVLADVLTPEKAHLPLVRPATRAEHEAFASVDRRTYRRMTPSELSWLSGVRLKHGTAVSLIDLSVGGAQIEGATRFKPGTSIVIEIESEESQLAIPARVLRCHLSGLAPHPIYRGALRFARPLELPDGPATGGQTDADYNPVHECARLSLALERSSESNGAIPVIANPVAAKVWAGALATVLAMIESASGRRAGVPFRQEMSWLLRAIIRCVEKGATPDVLLRAIVERVRCSVPVLTIRVVHAGAALTIQSNGAVFDLPAAPHRTATKLLVELPTGCRLEEWQQEFLKAAARLIAATQDIEPALMSEPEVDRAKIFADPPGWIRLVVRYTDGHLMKGYSRNFTPSNGQIDVWPVPDGPPASRVTVSLTHLKAAFFVHDPSSLPPLAGPSPFEADSRPGRRIIVTFVDGEVMCGTTLDYSPGCPGFFVVPADAQTNNLRVFVVSAAVRHARFL